MTIYIEGVILQLTDTTGAIVVYTKKDMRGKQVNIGALFGDLRHRHNFNSNVVSRTVGSEQVFAAIFPRVPVGEYIVQETEYWHLVRKHHENFITVFPGEVAEVDWR